MEAQSLTGASGNQASRGTGGPRWDPASHETGSPSWDRMPRGNDKSQLGPKSREIGSPSWDRLPLHENSEEAARRSALLEAKPLHAGRHMLRRSHSTSLRCRVSPPPEIRNEINTSERENPRGAMDCEWAVPVGLVCFGGPVTGPSTRSPGSLAVAACDVPRGPSSITRPNAAACHEDLEAPANAYMMQRRDAPPEPCCWRNSANCDQVFTAGERRAPPTNTGLAPWHMQTISVG